MCGLNDDTPVWVKWGCVDLVSTISNFNTSQRLQWIQSTQQQQNIPSVCRRTKQRLSGRGWVIKGHQLSTVTFVKQLRTSHACLRGCLILPEIRCVTKHNVSLGWWLFVEMGCWTNQGAGSGWLGGRRWSGGWNGGKEVTAGQEGGAGCVVRGRVSVWQRKQSNR